jgi:hypothetical protein
MENTIDDVPSIISARILEKAYKRIGIKVNFVQLPAERCLVLSNNGSLDGEVHHLHKSHHDIVSQISVSLREMEQEGIIQKERDLFIKELLKPY